MSNLLISFFAYFIDKFFGEFPYIKHPIIIIGELISLFEKKFYEDSVKRGAYLVVFILSTVFILSIALVYLLHLLPYIWMIIFSSIFASMFIAHNMLYHAVKEILTSEDKKHAISMLVSRDVQDMNDTDIYKAAIETYAENLSDGVVAPIFYLLLFNLPGIIIYKAINTMDSMVGYRNEKYENYGKVAAILDDIVNYIPSRITAILIMILGSQRDIFAFYPQGKEHESPNAGHPITAMALVLGVKLGGNTSYFGKIKTKPYFGEGREEIKADDLSRALRFTKL